jgi:hypothetical protein
MSRRATFGDFAAAADRHLDALPAPVLQHPDAARQRGTARETADSVRAAIRPLTAYVADVSAAFSTIPVRDRHSHAPWIRAADRSREVLANAAACLRPVPPDDPPHGRSSSQTAVAVRAAADSMTIGRDLLHTHIAPADGGTWQARSEWAPAITSVPVARALLHHVAGWAGKIAPHGGQAALSGMSGTTRDRRALNAACQWLQVLQWAVDAASEAQPVPASDLDLLHAIPVNTPVPRHLPSGGEPVTGLCQGIIGAAKRARAAALAATRAGPWSPDLTRESVRHVAGHCTASWNCHLVLQALASSNDHPAPVTAQLRAAADAADAARAAWLRAAHAWDTVITVTPGGLSPSAIAAEDLALWTGRLAYADPDWTPAAGPSRASRPLADLAPRPGDLGRAAAAVDHACHALSRLAAANHQQIQRAATTGQLIIPARNLSASHEIPYTFAPAPPWALTPLTDAYHHAQAASDRAATAAAGLAAAVKAPSRVLTTARTAQHANLPDCKPPVPAPAARVLQRPAMPGPAESVLLDLGVTNRADLQAAADLDKATTQLILRAATSTGTTPGHHPPHPASPAGSVELITQLAATSEGKAALTAPHPAGSTRTRAPLKSQILVRTDLPAGPLAPRQAPAKDPPTTNTATRKTALASPLPSPHGTPAGQPSTPNGKPASDHDGTCDTMSHALSERVEEVRRDARDIAPGCVRPVPAVTCVAGS